MPLPVFLTPFETLTIEEFRRIITAVLMGRIYRTKVTLPHLKRPEHERGLPFPLWQALALQSPYSTAQHGLEWLLECCGQS